MKTFCLTLSLLFSLLSFSEVTAKSSRNVLLLISDNQNWNDCGCYGNKIVQTPHIDQLAREGVRFREAFATTASCGPSRAVIYTGLQTHANGQYGHGHGLHTFQLKPKVQTIFQMLKEKGYRTALLGKQHVMPKAAYPFSFNPNVGTRDVLGLAKAGKEFMQQKSEKPFLLVIGYSDPHPTSRNRPGWGIKRNYPGVQPVVYDPKKIIVPDYLPDKPEVREGLAGYYQEISRLDTGVGAILQALKDAGKADDTLVMFTSDHGSSEPGAMANHYEPGVRVPFIVRNPLLKKAGIVNNGLITLADIVPTILDWTETALPKQKLHGRSFLPILAEENPEGWDEVFLSHVNHEVTMYYPMRTIRTRKYKMIWNINWKAEYPLPIDTLNRATWQETLRRGDRLIGKRTVKKYLQRDEIELYDLSKDNDEVINLVNNPNYTAVKQELTRKLHNWLKETEDHWITRHDLPGVKNAERSPAYLHRQQLAKEQGYTSLFNGKNLDGWTLRRANRKGYAVEDGLLTCPADGGGFLFTEHEYANFSLRFQFRLTKGANNGIAIRCPLVDARPAYEGMEIQLLDTRGYAGPLRPNQRHGSLYDVLPAKQGALKPVGEWNDEEIICKGDRITVIVNEMVVLDVHLDKIDDTALLKKHPGLKRHTGHIGLLGHGAKVDFKNIRVKEFKTDQSKR